ncbi:MAG TPA: DUF362 domain-containing protein [Candidatus Lokiarchaeia archaeon]|nr:DUF362 domain-containing protein [Candidatus Lokiarchaeia archaeon]
MEAPSLIVEFGEDLSISFALGMEKLGGLQSQVPPGKPIFIAISMPYPEPAPSSTSFAILDLVLAEIQSLNEPQVVVAAVPEWGFAAEKVANSLGLFELAKHYGAEFLVLDGIQRDLSSPTGIKATFPQELLDSSYFISIPSIRFDPLQGFIAACEVNTQFLEVKEKLPQGNPKVCSENSLSLQDKALEAILMALNKRLPDLTIVDGYNILAGQGPALFTGGTQYNARFVLIGKNSFAVDLAIAKILGFASNEIPLIERAQQAGVVDEQAISPENEIILQQKQELVVPPPRAVKDFTYNLPNRINVSEGNACCLCEQNLRVVCDFLREFGKKDLNLVEQLNFIVGSAPPTPRAKKNICIFGECARNASQNASFRSITIKRIVKTGEEKEVTKRNKKILEIRGCPPLPLETLRHISKFFSPSNFPSTTFWLAAWGNLQSKQKQKQTRAVHSRRA